MPGKEYRYEYGYAVAVYLPGLAGSMLRVQFPGVRRITSSVPHPYTPSR